MSKPPTDIEARFWPKVEKTKAGCWLWLGAKTNGYGRFSVPPSRSVLAHRVAYELLVGPIPHGMTLDHTCRNHGCVNPAHSEPVPLPVNIRRGGNAQKTHCPHGHAYTEDNTNRDRHGRRYCRTCSRDRGRRRRGRQRRTLVR